MDRFYITRLASVAALGIQGSQEAPAGQTATGVQEAREREKIMARGSFSIVRDKRLYTGHS
jgi:hypothetical protein